jgi:hypothetical protein
MSTYQSTSDWSIEVPLSQTAWQIAQQFAQEQSPPPKATQIRQNALAVLAVRDYLTWHQIETDLTASDIWNPAVRLIENTADLVLPGLGRVECRPIAAGEETCELPMESWGDRIGYFIVEIGTDEDIPRLLGFAPPVLDWDNPKTELHRTELLSLDQFHELMARRQWIKRAIDDTFRDLQPLFSSPEEREAIETEWSWIVLTKKSSQWRRLGTEVLEQHSDEQDNVLLGNEANTPIPATLNQSTPPDTADWQNLVRDLFDALSDEFSDDSES